VAVGQQKMMFLGSGLVAYEVCRLSYKDDRYIDLD